MAADDRHRSSLRIRTLRVTFRDALAQANDVEQPERARYIGVIVTKALAILANIRADAPDAAHGANGADAGDVDALAEEIDEAASQGTFVA